MRGLSCLALIIILVRVTLGLNYITEKPDFLSSCSIRDPNFSQCSKNNLQQLFNQLRDGIPELKSLPAIDPYPINKIKLEQNSGSTSLAVEMKNVIVNGFGNIVIKENSVDEKDYSWATKIFVPKLRIDGDYKMNGVILALTLKGQGKLFFELERIDLNLETKVKLYEKAGLTFGNVTDVKSDFKIGGLKTRLNNLFNGSLELEDSLNAIFNENWMDFLEALRPALSETVESILKDILKKVFHFIPAKYFISDIPTSEQLYG